MFTRIIALLMIVALIGCSTAPRSGPSPSDQDAPAVLSTDIDKPAPSPDAERTAPAKMDPAEPASEPAEATPDHGHELGKAIKVAAKAVVVTAFVIVGLAVSLVAAL